MIDPRARLAALGVGVFDAAPAGPPSMDASEYPAFLVRLARSGDARLKAAIPCLPDLAGDAASMFDLWLRLPAVA